MISEGCSGQRGSVDQQSGRPYENGEWTYFEFQVPMSEAVAMH